VEASLGAIYPKIVCARHRRTSALEDMHAAASVAGEVVARFRLSDAPAPLRAGAGAAEALTLRIPRR